MADACSRIADKRAELGRANPEDDKNMLGCCSYCGGDITEPGTTLCIGEESLDYSRGVWWMKARGLDTWSRCYVRYETVTNRDGDTIVELKGCLYCNEEVKIMNRTLGDFDADSDDSGQGSMYGPLVGSRA